MNRRPLVVFVCCWITGASIPSLWDTQGKMLMLGAVTLWLAAAWMFGRLNLGLAAACAAALWLAFGERMMAEHRQRSDMSALWPTDDVPQAVALSGVMSSAIQVDGDAATFRLSAQSVQLTPRDELLRIDEQVLVRVKLKAPQEQKTASQWQRGDPFRITGVPEPPADAGNLGAFDYRKYLAGQGIHWVWAVEGADAVRRQDAEIPLMVRPLRAVDELRSAIGSLMDRLYPGEDTGYMKGLVAGITDEVDPAQYDAFSRLGLTHVLAISGLHVAVVAFILLRLAAMAGMTRERAIDVTFAAMPVYMLLTGASPSAVRACLTAMIALALARRHKLKDGLHLLAAAALVMTMWNPLIVENVSFQLSFAVTAGLLMFTPVVSALLHRIPGKPFREALAVGITAQIVSFPLSAYYFHSLHLLSLPANLVLVPFISFVVMPLGMASVALGAAWFPLGIVPAKMAAYGNTLTFWIVNRMQDGEGFRTIWPQMSWLWVAAGYGLLGVSAWQLRRWEAVRQERQWLLAELQEETAPLDVPHALPSSMKIWIPSAFIMAVLWAGWLVWGCRPAWLDHDAYVQFLDVGQGDAILIRTGNGHHMLIDTGGTVTFRKPGDAWRDRRDPYEVGRKLLVPLLRQRGVRQLEALVLTHLDNDHIGGAEAVIRNIPVKAVIWNGTRKSGPQSEGLLRLISDRGIPIYAARQGLKWQLDASAELDVLYPAGQGPGKLPVSVPKQNRQSVVLLAKLYGRQFLLPGDIEALGEAAVVQAETHTATSGRAAAGERHVDVLKAAHHGSKTSTSEEWLHYWQPSQAIVSVGRRNPYGHPHPLVLSRLRDARIPLLRTDQDGEIQYRIRPDGNMLQRHKRMPAPGHPSAE